MKRVRKKHGCSRILALLVPFIAIGIVLTVGSPELGANPTEPTKRKVLVLHGLWRIRNWEIPFNSALHTALLADQSLSVGISHIYLGLDNNPEEAFPQSTIDAVQAQVSRDPADLVISVLPGAGRFLLTQGRVLFPELPLIAVLPSHQDLSALKAMGTTVISSDGGKMALRKTVDVIFTLLPETATLVVVAGAGDLDSRYLKIAKAAIDAAAPGVRVTYLIGPPPDALWPQVGALPEHSAILFTTYDRDRLGQKQHTAEVVKHLAARANAPVFGMIDSFLGTGIVGGYLSSATYFAKASAQLALAGLKGERAAIIPPPEEHLTYGFDGRALDRWKIPASRLPAGSKVIPPRARLWPTYKVHVITVFAVVLIQAFLIALLAALLTRTRQIKQALARSEARYRSLYDNIPVGIFQTSEDRLVRANPAALAMFDLDPVDDLANHPLPGFYLDPQTHAQALASFSSGGELQEFEAQFKRLDGSIFWGSLNATQVVDARTHETMVDGIIQDISERKRAESQLVREKRFSETILDSLPGIFYMYDEELRLVRWNQNRDIESGYSDEELSQMSVPNFHNGQDLEKVIHGIQQVFQHGKASVEAEFINKDGSRTPYFFTGKRLVQNGQRYALGIGIDISYRLEMEASLRNSERRLADIINFLPDATFVIDTQGVVVAWNHAIERLSGVPAAEMVGKGNYEYALPFYGDRRPCLIDLALRWDAEAAAAYATIEERDGILYAETANPRFRSTPSLFWNSSRKLYNSNGEAVGAIEVIRDISERKLMEDALRASEQRYRSIVEDQTECVYRWLPDGTLTYANKAYCRFLGVSEAECLGTNHHPFIDADDLKAMRRRLSTLTPASPVSAGTLRLKGPGGDTIWHQVVDRAIFDAEGGLVEYQTVGRDVTQQRQAEAALKASEARFRSLVSNIPGAVYRCDKDHHWTMHFLSEAITAICGFPADDFIDNRVRPFSSIIHPEDRDRVDQVVATAIAGRGPFAVEYRIQTADGQQRWVYESGTSVLGRAGAVQYLDGVIFDITDRRMAHEALKESEGRYRTLFQGANDAIFIIRDHIIVDCNEKALEIFGCRREEIIGYPPSKFSPTHQPDGIASTEKERAKTALAMGGEPQDFDWLHQRLDGSHFEVHVSLNEVMLRSGPHIMAIVRDITQRKRAEAERQRLEAQLRQAQKMEAIGTLAGGIAHDFNNILAAIIGFTEVSIRDLPASSKLAANLERVLSAANRAGDLVKQILTFSRQSPKALQPVQIKPIAKEALRLLRASLPATIELRLQILSDAVIRADPTQIHQIVMNLCTNAAHALPGDTGVIEVGLADVDEAVGEETYNRKGKFVRLRVRDNGSGISAEIQDRIFDPFFTTKAQGEGTGLGLSVVHGIVKDYGGWITLKSDPGSGTCFDLFFPVIERETVAATPKATPLPTGSERILFVDDEESQVALAQQVFGLLGYAVIGTTSSLEALEMFAAGPQRYDLLITDLTMPKMTGDVLAQRTMALRPDLPVILCTGNRDKISSQKRAELGIKAVIMKPAAVKEMANTVRRVLDRLH